MRRGIFVALFYSVFAVVLVFAASANASVWNILPTMQNGIAGTAGDPGGVDPNAPTRGMVFWFTVGVNGGGQQLLYGQGIGPGYACYGLVAPTGTCAADGQQEIWVSQPVTYTGSLNDDRSYLNLSWTGQAGSAVDFGTVTLFTSSILSGNYDTSGAPSGTDPGMAGYDSDGFSCWNDPLVTLPGPPDFCGNGTGNSFTAPPFFAQTILSRALPDGLNLMVDNMDGTISLTLTDSTYSSCVASPACAPGTGSADIFAQWTVDATNIGELVPDVVGLAQTAAENAITAVNLTVGMITAIVDNAPADEVLAQNPDAGSAIPGDVVPAGTGVDLIVSLGPGAGAHIISISGMQSPVDGACVAAIPATGGFDCSYDASDPIGAGTNWSGPVIGTGYYAVGTSPFALGGTQADQQTGDNKVRIALYETPPFASEISIDDGAGNSPSCNLNDRIGGLLSLSAATRWFAGPPGTKGEESWDDGMVRIQIPMTQVTRATSNGGGGCDYEIASNGFPARLNITGGVPPNDKYPSDVSAAPGTYVAPSPLSVFCGTNGGGFLGSTGNGTEGNCGAVVPATLIGPTGDINDADASDWSCQDNTNVAPKRCNIFSQPSSGACDFNQSNYCGVRNEFENVLIEIKRNVNGDITSGLIYMQNESRIFNVGPPDPDTNSWDGAVYDFTGTCTNCPAVVEPPAALYAVTGASNTPSTLFELDPDTGAIVRTIGATGFSHITAMDSHPLTGDLFAVAQNIGFPVTGALLTLDTDTGVGTVVAQTGAFSDMGFHPDGRLFANGKPDGFDDRVFEIDVSTGAYAPVADIGHPHRPGITFDSLGNGITKQNNTFYAFNPDIPSTIFLGGVSGNTLLNTLDYSETDILYGVTQNSLVTISINTLTQTVIGPVFNRYTALAFEAEKCYSVDAIDDAYTVINDGTPADLKVLVNDRCKSDRPVTIVTLPGDLLPDQGGSAITDGATITYTPPGGVVGPESFSYTAQDAGLDGGDDPPSVDQDTAMVTVNLLEDLFPDAVDDEVEMIRSRGIVIDILENDVLGNPPNTFSIIRQPDHGQVYNQTETTINYFSDNNYLGIDTFDYELIDANGDSDIATVRVSVFFGGGVMPIDIAPHDDGNNINLKSGRATVEVAILSVGEFFDAPTMINPLSLRLDPQQAPIIGNPKFRDIDHDGDVDLLVRFILSQSGIVCGATSARITGGTFAGQAVFATDSLNTTGCPRL